jgi:hypothetical protein
VVTFTGDVKLVVNSVDLLLNPVPVTLGQVIIDLSDGGSVVVEAHAALQLAVSSAAGLDVAGVITTNNDDAVNDTGIVASAAASGDLATDVPGGAVTVAGLISSPTTINKKDRFAVSSGVISVESIK